MTDSSSKVLWLQWINDDKFSILRYAPNSRIPSLLLELTSSFVSICRTNDELSIVCSSKVLNDIDDSYMSIEHDYICFKGIINAISSRYVEFGISIFVVSTYDTDYVLTKVSNHNNITTSKLIEMIFHDYNHHHKYTFKFKELLFSSGYQSKINTLLHFIDHSDVNNIIQSKINKVINIHIIGADEQELPSMNESIINTMYSRVIEKCYNDFQIDRVNMVFIGPNMNIEYHEKEVNFKTFYLNKEIVINVSAYSSMYHDHFDNDSKALKLSNPDIIVLYNAGIWGYESWLATLNVFRYLQTAILLTSYTIEEGEDDEDTIEEYYRDNHVSNSIYRWGWSAVDNPNKSNQKLQRKTMEERHYYENSSWSALFIR